MWKSNQFGQINYLLSLWASCVLYLFLLHHEFNQPSAFPGSKDTFQNRIKKGIQQLIVFLMLSFLSEGKISYWKAAQHLICCQYLRNCSNKKKLGKLSSALSSHQCCLSHSTTNSDHIRINIIIWLIMRGKGRSANNYG